MILAGSGDPLEIRLRVVTNLSKEVLNKYLVTVN